MAKLNYNSSTDYSGLNGNLMGIISTFCVMFCMIVTVLGIKLKWFKHRMNFEQTPQSGNNNTTNNRRDNFRNTSENRFSQTAMNCHGVFRRLQDDEMPIERSETLPPIRIKSSSSRQQLHVIPSKVNNKNDNIPDPPLHSPPVHSNDDIHVPANREIFKNMKFNAFPTNTDLFPKVHNQQKPISKSRQDRSKSPKKNESPNKDNSQLSHKHQSPTRQHQSKSPQKQRSKENSSEETNSIDKRLKKSSKTTNFLELDTEAIKTNNNKKTRQFEKFKEEKNVKFADNSPEQIIERRPTGYLRPEEINLNNDDEILKDISTRRPTGFLRPTKEEIAELENFDNIIDEIDQQYPGTLQNKKGRLVFKIDGLNDNEVEQNLMKTIPKAEPRATIKKSLEEQNNEQSNNLMPLASLNGEENNNNTTDSWSAVRQHRKLTQEMAKHHQAIRDAAQIKATKRQLKNPLAYDLDINQKSDFNKTENNKNQNQRKDNSSIHNFDVPNPRFSNNSTEA